MSESVIRGGRVLPVWWQTGRRTPLWWIVLFGGSALLAADTVLNFERHTYPARFLVLGNAGQIAEFTVGLLFWMWRAGDLEHRGLGAEGERLLGAVEREAVIAKPGGVHPPGAAARSVASKSVPGIGPTHGEVAPAAR